MSFIQCHLNEFFKEFETDNKARIKAGQTAAKIEGFRLRGVLKKELQAASPGGRTFAPLTELAKASTGAKHKKKPLYNLSRIIRYNIAEREPYKVEIGFVGNAGSYEPLKKLAKIHQEGLTFPVGNLRDVLKKVGIQLRKEKKKEAKYFFLRSTTTQFKDPIRDIVDSFWAAHQGEVMPNIQSNFERKMRGERI